MDRGHVAGEVPVIDLIRRLDVDQPVGIVVGETVHAVEAGGGRVLDIRRVAQDAGRAVARAVDNLRAFAAPANVIGGDVEVDRSANGCPHEIVVGHLLLAHIVVVVNAAVARDLGRVRRVAIVGQLNREPVDALRIVAGVLAEGPVQHARGTDRGLAREPARAAVADQRVTDRLARLAGVAADAEGLHVDFGIIGVRLVGVVVVEEYVPIERRAVDGRAAVARRNRQRHGLAGAAAAAPIDVQIVRAGRRLHVNVRLPGKNAVPVKAESGRDRAPRGGREAEIARVVRVVHRVADSRGKAVVNVNRCGTRNHRRGVHLGHVDMGDGCDRQAGLVGHPDREAVRTAAVQLRGRPGKNAGRRVDRRRGRAGVHAQVHRFDAVGERAGTPAGVNSASATSGSEASWLKS